MRKLELYSWLDLNYQISKATGAHTVEWRAHPVVRHLFIEAYDKYQKHEYGGKSYGMNGDTLEFLFPAGVKIVVTPDQSLEPWTLVFPEKPKHRFHVEEIDVTPQ
jgi:hypothetical protein